MSLEGNKRPHIAENVSLRKQLEPPGTTNSFVADNYLVMGEGRPVFQSPTSLLRRGMGNLDFRRESIVTSDIPFVHRGFAEPVPASSIPHVVQPSGSAQGAEIKEPVEITEAKIGRGRRRGRNGEKGPTVQPENLEEGSGTRSIERLAYDPNILRLDEKKLDELAIEFRTHGLTEARIGQIYGLRLRAMNPVLHDWIILAGDRVKSEGENVTSFHRGVALGYYLIDKATSNYPSDLDTASLNVATNYLNRPATYEDLKTATHVLLRSQHSLWQAFDESLPGLPKKTDYGTACFGGGLVLLGIIVADGLKDKS